MGICRQVVINAAFTADSKSRNLMGGKESVIITAAVAEPVALSVKAECGHDA